MPDYCADSRSAARHHILTFKGSAAALGAVQAWAAGLGAHSKSAEIRAEFRKTNSLYPY